MSIAVNSYTELYTTLLGWQLYDQIWDILSKTGVAFLPFIGIVLKNIAQPYASQETKDAGCTSLRRMELDFLTTLLLIFLAVSPALKLDPKMIFYTPACQADGKKETHYPGDTGTTYDGAFVLPQEELRVPIWWYAVMSISEGMTAGASTLVACKTNLRQMVAQVDMAKINDPELKQSVMQFEQDCYAPTRMQYLKDLNIQSSYVDTIKDARAMYGEADTEWPGSHAFSETYYKNRRASQPIKGFFYQSSQDINADTNAEHPPIYGTPTCDVWWNDSRNGLKNRLKALLPVDFARSYAPYYERDPRRLDDMMRSLLFNNAGFDKVNKEENGWSPSGMIAGLGSWLQGIEGYPKLYIASQVEPIIQGMLLMMVYAFLPIALVFTGYKPSSFVIGAVIIFSLIFWSFIWQLVLWTDSTLMDALSDNNLFSKLSPNGVLADLTMGTMLIVAPLFWFSFMGSMGVKVGELVGKSASKLGSVGDSAASNGAGIVQTGIRAGISSIKK